MLAIHIEEFQSVALLSPTIWPDAVVTRCVRIGGFQQQRFGAQGADGTVGLITAEEMGIEFELLH